ncbi:ferredoxin III, nif-specific [Paraburkholderia sabiae]|uniref:Ferredoxin III n=1 Tax=Paraburkholderia sabiae TaxID=273251 RepID=A0ABU9QQT1_9BURK|nr:ferredoxin III, nif-specific [Paraburkholderia sabiae]WJZ79421.1 ferredoxin III, nif-specific [Paraburkholderia sabiae]CAD6562736.1 Ferredoxin-3 [Paraburkholderia sabiae]
MNGTFSVKLPGGKIWTPAFVCSLDEQKCIGCGRCFRVCSQGVLQLVGVSEDGALIPFDDDDEDEYQKKVMTIAHPQLCIGCTACAKICPKKCYRHVPAQI